MSELTLAELNSLQLELLPARTVLSMLTFSSEGATGANGTDGSNSVGTPTINVAGVPLSMPTLGR
jgi:hypothetical protein